MKESFLLYKSFYDPIKELSIEDKGHLLDAIFKYQIDGTEPFNTSRIYMPFMFFKNQFRLDDIKYQKIVERNKINGSKGGRPKNPDKAKKPSGLFGNPENPEKPKKPDNDNEKGNDNEKEFNMFWDSFHEITSKKKTDKEPTLKYWNKLSDSEKQKALDNIKSYFTSLSDSKYCKKARTYLADKNFNDEFKVNGKAEIRLSNDAMINLSKDLQNKIKSGKLSEKEAFKIQFDDN